MRVKIKNDYTLTAFNNLIDAVLLTDDHRILIIRKVEAEIVTETPSKQKEKKGYFVRKKDRVDTTPKTTTYITKFLLEGFDHDLNFLGTYNEDYCKTFINIQDDKHHPQNVIKMREKWIKLKEQLEGFGFKIVLDPPTEEKEKIEK